MQGWECPKCGKCYAPHVDECKQCGSKTSNTTPALPDLPIQPISPIWVVPYWERFYYKRPDWELPVITCGTSSSAIASGTLWFDTVTDATKPQ